MTTALPFTPAPMLDRPFDRELTQLAMGMRQVVKREFSSDATLDELRALGWALRIADGGYDVADDSADVHHDGGRHFTVFFGAAAAVETACDLEEIERHGKGGERLDAMAALGGLLGYPPCCTAAYLTQEEQSESASFARLFEAGPHTGLPHWNNLFVLNHALISHFPCTLDCTASAELAGATWSQLASLDEARAAAVARLLASPITVWDRYRFLVEHPDHGPLTPNQIDGTPFLLAHPPLVDFVNALERLPAHGTRLEFR